MSTQKAKFDLFSRLGALGFTYDEAVALRRIEMTLHRWSEQECGDGNERASWSIERDETSGKPFRCVYPHDGKAQRYPIADREAGALQRLGKILGARNKRALAGSPYPSTGATDVRYYQQGDPRGCALYLIRPGDVPAGESVESYYTRGLAVAA